MPFDPDAYIAEKTKAMPAFDPDAFLKERGISMAGSMRSDPNSELVGPGPAAVGSLLGGEPGPKVPGWMAPLVPAARRVASTVTEPAAAIARGVSEIPENPIAGAAKAATGVLGAVAIPFTAGTEMVRSIPVVGEPLAKAVSLPFEAIAKGVELGEQGIQKLLDAAGVSKDVQNLGLSPEKAKVAAQSMSGLNQTLAQFVIPVAAKTALASVKAKIAAGRTPSVADRNILRQNGIDPAAKDVAPKIDEKLAKSESAEKVQTAVGQAQRPNEPIDVAQAGKITGAEDLPPLEVKPSPSATPGEIAPPAKAGGAKTEVGGRWTSGAEEAAAIPGEPISFLDADKYLQNAKATISLIEEETGQKAGYELRDVTGKTIPRSKRNPLFETVEDAQAHAESVFPKVEVQQIPTSARRDVIARLGGSDVMTANGALGRLSDKDLITYAKEKGQYEAAPLSEAPKEKVAEILKANGFTEEQAQRVAEAAAKERGPANAEAVKQAGGKIPPVTYATETTPEGSVRVKAMRGDKEVGHAVFIENLKLDPSAPTTYASGDTWVDAAERRKGVATGMYEKARTEGLNLTPSEVHTEEGKALQGALGAKDVFAESPSIAKPKRGSLINELLNLKDQVNATGAFKGEKRSFKGRAQAIRDAQLKASQNGLDFRVDNSGRAEVLDISGEKPKTLRFQRETTLDKPIEGATTLGDIGPDKLDKMRSIIAAAGSDLHVGDLTKAQVEAALKDIATDSGKEKSARAQEVLSALEESINAGTVPIRRGIKGGKWQIVEAPVDEAVKVGEEARGASGGESPVVGRPPGEPAKFTPSKAGPQGELLSAEEKGQAVAPKTAIASNIPLSEQVKGTMFEPKVEAGSELPFAGNWEKGESRPFAFDPNSTTNEGRFRLAPPETIKPNSYFSRESSTSGVRYVMGIPKKGGKAIIQAVRFDKGKFAEEQAAEWWGKNSERLGRKSIEEAAGPAASQMVPVPVLMEPAQAKPVKASAIISQVSKDLGVPIRTGHASFRTRAGFFKVESEVVRNKEANDLAVTSHEIAHFIDKKVLGAHQTGSSQRFSAWRKELADLDYDQKKRRTNEGFAEFVRHYVTMDDAQTIAPKFYDHFTKDFLPANPKIAEALGKMKESVAEWRNQGAASRILSQIDFDGSKAKPTISEAVAKAGRGVQKTIDNALAPLNRFVNEMVKETGRKPEPRQDPYQIAMAVAKTAPAKAREFVLEGAFDFRLNKIGPSLKEVLAPVTNDVPGAIAYAYAKRAIELHGRGINPGITLEDAQYLIKTKQTPALEKFVQDITDWNGRVMDYLVDAGGLSKDAAKAIRESNLVYIPLKRVFVDEATSFGQGKGFTDLPSPIKKIRGSGREIQNPLESMIQQTEQILGVADKVRVARAVVDVAEMGQGTGKWVEKVAAPMQATKFEAEQLRGQLSQMGIEFPLEEMDNVLTVFTQSQRYFGKDNIVSIVREGKREFYELHPDLFAAMKGLDKLTLPWFINQTFGRFSRGVRLGATGIRAGFSLITNPIRDAQTFALQTEHTRGTPDLALRGIFKDLGGSEVARQFRASGGEMAQPLGLDRRMVQNLVEEALMSDAKSKALHVVHHPIEALKELISFPEAGPRLAEFEAVMNKYKPQIDEALSRGDNVRASQLRENAAVEAANAAADVTVNFRRMGTYTAVLNQIIPFFNPGVQGITKMGRTIIEHPVRSGLRATAVLTAPTLALWYVNKDEDWYKALPEWQKLGFWNFKVGDQIVRLPKPFEWGYLFAGIPEAALNASYQKDPELFTRTLTQIGKNFGPVDFTDPVSMVISPALVKPAAEAYFNWDTFRDRPIVPRGLEGLLPEDQYTAYSSGTAKTLGKILGVAPPKIDHVLSGYTGGLAADILKGLPSQVKEAADIPVVGRIFTRQDALGFGSEPVQRFYEILDKATRYKTTIDRYIKLKPGEVPDMERVRRAADLLSYDENAVALYSAFKMLNQTATTLKDLREKLRSIDQVGVDPGVRKLMRDAVNKAAVTLVNTAQATTKIVKRAKVASLTKTGGSQ